MTPPPPELSETLNTNDTNGTVVTAKLRRVQQLLMAIRGASAPPVYSPHASRYGALGTRDLDRA